MGVADKAAEEGEEGGAEKEEGEGEGMEEDEEEEDDIELEDGLARLPPERTGPLAERVASAVWRHAGCYRLATAVGVVDATHVW